MARYSSMAVPRAVVPAVLVPPGDTTCRGHGGSGLKGTHAQFLGQGERLLVVRFGLLSLRRLSLRCNLAKEPQGIGFVAPFLMGPGELQGTLRLGAASSSRPAQQIRLAQPDHPERMVEHETHRDGLRDRLLQQRQGLGGPSGERIGRPQETRRPGGRGAGCAPPARGREPVRAWG